MTPLLQSVELPSGVRLQYAEQGDPAGVPVLMLHGVTDSWRSFEPVLPHLPRSTARVRTEPARPRRRGGAGHRLSHARLRRGRRGVQDVLGLRRVVIAGHSMGSSNAMRFAIDHPQRTLGVVLLGAFASYRQQARAGRLLADAGAAADRAGRLRVRARVPAEHAGAAGAAGVLRHRDARMPEGARRMSGAAPSRACSRTISPASSEKSPRRPWSFWGDRDAFAHRADQDALVAGIPGARLVVYEGTGHALHWEEPERFAADLTAFVTALDDADAHGRHRGTEPRVRRQWRAGVE